MSCDCQSSCPPDPCKKTQCGCQTPQPCVQMSQAQYDCIMKQIQQLDLRDQDFNKRLSLIEGSINTIPFETGSLGVISGSGLPGVTQAQIVAAVSGKAIDGLIVAGNQAWPGQTLDESFGVLAAFEGQKTLYPALGNYELDQAVNGSPTIERFDDLFDGKGYYKVHLSKGNIDIFVLSSGYNSANAAVEAGGNGVGSTQYLWFVQQLFASTARWKVVVFHHPIFSISEAGIFYDESVLDWGFENLGVHLVINGHSRANMHFRRGGLDYVAIALGTETPDELDAPAITDPTLIQGAVGSYVVYADTDGAGDSGFPAFGVLTASEYSLRFDIFRVSGGALIHTFTR